MPPDFDEHESFRTAASETENADVARRLMEAGALPHEFENSVLQQLTGAALIEKQTVTFEQYEAQKHRIFGTKNPEPVAYEYWLEMIRSGEPAYWGEKKFGKLPGYYDTPAIWCFHRFGMSTTELPGNVWVQIAGEHEDYYDSEFCIYSDVVVHDGKGNTQIYIYPREVFPPTDFHTATLVGDAIILIGSLGYMDERPIDTTQVLRLNLKDYSIDRIETSGDLPGWISSHKARLDRDTVIVEDGEVWDGDDLVPLDGAWGLTLKTGVWRKLEQN